MVHRIKVNHKFDFETELHGKQQLVNGEAINANVKQLSANTYHVLHKLASYNVEVVNLNAGTKTAEVKVNGNTYQVTAKDQYDVLLDQLGFSNTDNSKISDIKAPMPGLVLKVFVNEGDEIKKGDNLFVLEAMKMENIIKAPADVVIKKIKIQPSDKVEKGQILMQF